MERLCAVEREWRMFMIERCGRNIALYIEKDSLVFIIRDGVQ